MERRCGKLSVVQQSWLAPRRSEPVHARVVLPGSKSHTARELILSALADGPSLLRAPLAARDTLLMAAALRALGVGVDEQAEGWLVTPAALRAGTVDVGLAGTVMRFVPPLAALARGDVGFDGDPAARRRPMSTLIQAMVQAGIDVDSADGFLPLTVHGTGRVRGGRVDIDAAASSQFVSALLLAAPRWNDGVQLRHVGDKPVPSAPHLAMTVAALRARGVDVDDAVAAQWQVSPGPVGAGDVTIEPDLSNAAPFLAAAMVTGGDVTVSHWPEHTHQPGAVLPELLTRMGARVQRTGSDLQIIGTGEITGLDADLSAVGELTPVLAALAALAGTPSRLRGIAHLRGHETDRLAALVTEINGLGGAAHELEDGIAIEPRPLRAGLWHAYADHRMAQAGAVVGLAVDGVRVDDIASTTKTLADFPGMWSSVLAG